MDLLTQNLSLLAATRPDLVRRVKRSADEGRVTVEKARNGQPVPRLDEINLHSTYQPEAEAARAIQEFSGKGINAVYGLGFGYHVREILKAGDGPVHIIEPSLDLFRAFLSHIDIREFLPRCVFHVAEPVEQILARQKHRLWKVYPHRPTLRLHPAYFERMERGKNLADFMLARPLRILVVHPVAGGSLPTSRYCSQAFRNLGHVVREVESDAFSSGHEHLRSTSKDPVRTAALSRRFMDLLGEMAAVAADEFRPDLILALAQAPLNPDSIRRLQTLGVPVAFWFVEDFHVFPYWEEVAGVYDHFFTLQQGEFHDRLAAAGVKRPYYLPQACSPDVHKPMGLSAGDRARYEADLSFMGAGYYNRQQAFLKLLDFDLKIWGTEWNLNSPVGQRVQNDNRRVSGEEIVKIYNAGRVNLNLHSSRYHEGVNPEGDFVNPRTFEIAACGGFQLVDRREELDALFIPDKEIALFEDLAGLKEKIAYYLAHPGERERIALAGRHRVLQEHTLEQRMLELLFVVFIDRSEWLESRVLGRENMGNRWIEQAGEGTALGRYLERYRGQAGWTLDTVVEDIQQGEGSLEPEECLILMVDQFFKRKE